jgi:hypothetical protein
LTEVSGRPKRHYLKKWFPSCRRDAWWRRRRMCGSALDEGGRAARRKLMGGHKTPPLFSRQGLEDRSSLAIFFT